LCPNLTVASLFFLSDWWWTRLWNENEEDRLAESLIPLLFSLAISFGPLACRQEQKETVALGYSLLLNSEKTKRNCCWRTVNHKTAAKIKKKSHGGCQVNGPKVAKFLDR